MIEFRVDLAPKPKNSRRTLPVQKAGKRKRYRIVESEAFRGWERAFLLKAKVALRGVPELPAPVSVCVYFLMPRPKRLKGEGRQRHAVRPDPENLYKGVGDALTSLGVWGDDGRVSDLTIRKRYAAPGETACIMARLFTVPKDVAHEVGREFE